MGIAAGIGFVTAAAALWPRSLQAQNVKEFVVRLQDVTPGVQQTGNANISGTVKAGAFQGNGGSLTGINWNNLVNVPAGFLDGIDNDTVYSAGAGLNLAGTIFNIASRGVVPGMLSISGATEKTQALMTDDLVNVTWGFPTAGGLDLPMTASTTAATGLTLNTSGGATTLLDLNATSTTGASVALDASANSATAFAARIRNTAATGNSVAGFFETLSTTGRAVVGSASATSGSSFGGYFGTASGSGAAVYGEASSSIGTAIGGRFLSLAEDGVAGSFSVTGANARAAEFVNLSESTTTFIGMPGCAIATNGYLFREYVGGSYRAAIPVAYGSVGSTGTIRGGSGNFTVAYISAGTYDVTVNNNSFTEATWSVSVTPVAVSTPNTVSVTDSGNAFRVRIHRFSAGNFALTDTAFQFTAFVRDPAPPSLKP
ncbi:MAG: hypothetical protein HONBIEJF_01473 [Fimbriimonadaceae bacterium]|nr:hypothetical protein [Fimbriimonadaceae bacterium]